MSLNVSGLIRVPSTVNQACTARKPASRASELPIVRVWREPVAGERGEPVWTVCRNRDSVGALSTTGSLLPSGDSGTQHRRTRPRRCAACVGRLGAGPRDPGGCTRADMSGIADLGQLPDLSIDGANSRG